MNRIVLVHLTLVGPNVAPATVEFGRHANVVRGPSDTGKSFVVDAIDFMLGASSLKEVPEGSGYEVALLGISDADGQSITLSRAVRGGEFGLWESDLRIMPTTPPPRTLGASHNAKNPENLSRFLLEKLGLDGRRIRKNAKNETVSLSFRNVARLCVVDETSMQATTSPVLSGRPTDKTKEVSTLRVLLQDEDDSSLVASPSKAERRKLTTAKTDVLDELLAELNAEIEDEPDPSERRDQLQRLRDAMDRDTNSIGNLTAKRSELVNALSQTQRLMSATERALRGADTLTARFTLLEEQYSSDLDRLDTVAEAGSLLGYFNPGQCVFCGADPEHQHFNDHPLTTDTTSFGEAVQAEQQKTATLRDDLGATLIDLETERAGLRVRLETLDTRARDLSDQVRSLDRELAPYKNTLNESLNIRSSLERILGVHDQIQRLAALRAQVAQEEDAETAVTAEALRESVLSDLTRKVSARLEAWGVPDSSAVRYDRASHDIATGDQLRSAHGKGVRAVLHAAFTVALADYCFDQGLPHPGFIVLDSPLVTYRPPDKGGPSSAKDRLDIGVAARFYADLEQNFAGQVIIMENMYPPNGLGPGSIDTHFTKSVDSGRYGYFPRSDPPP